jgi:hypothetical protein
MSITSGKVIVLTGLTALALVACGGGDGPYPFGDPPAGAGGQGGEIGIPDVETWAGPDCDALTPDHKIDGKIVNNPSHDLSYLPSEVTMKVEEILRFQPADAVQNMESGVNEVKDGKFHTPQGRRTCLQFHVAGTYPFFSLGAIKPTTGTLYVLP